MFYRRTFTCLARYTFHGRYSSSGRSRKRVRSPEVTNLLGIRSYLERHADEPVILMDCVQVRSQLSSFHLQRRNNADYLHCTAMWLRLEYYVLLKKSLYWNGCSIATKVTKHWYFRIFLIIIIIANSMWSLLFRYLDN